MQLKIEQCRGCGLTAPIVNRKHMMCQQCNWDRLHPQEGTYAENKAKRQAEVFDSLRSKTKRPKQVSVKQKVARSQVAEAYEQMAKTREHICTGCGTTQRLSHSHIIPRSRRKDLEADVRNITYHCLSMGEERGCHDIWEHGTLEEKATLNDFYDNMTYIEQIDFEYYNLITS